MAAELPPPEYTVASPGRRPVTRPVRLSTVTTRVSDERQIVGASCKSTSVNLLPDRHAPPVEYERVADCPTASVTSGGETLFRATPLQPQPPTPIVHADKSVILRMPTPH